MKKFHYRLQTMLKLKEHQERQKQKEHAQALEQVYRQKDKLKAIDSSRNTALNFQRQRLQSRLSIATMLTCSRYLLKLKGDTMLGREALNGLEREAEKKRLNLVEASKQRKIYEKLKDKQKERFYSEYERRDAIELDEIALTSHAHRARRR